MEYPRYLTEIQEVNNGVVEDTHMQGWVKGDSREAGVWRNVMATGVDTDSSMDEEEIIRIYQARAHMRGHATASDVTMSEVRDEAIAGDGEIDRGE